MKEMNAWNILECFGDRNAQPSVPCCCVLHGCKPTFDPQLEWSTLAEPEPNAALRAHRNCGNFMKHLKISMVQKYCVILRQLMIVHLYTSIQSVKYILLITGVAGAARLELIASLAPADSSAAWSACRREARRSSGVSQSLMISIDLPIMDSTWQQQNRAENLGSILNDHPRLEPPDYGGWKRWKSGRSGSTSEHILIKVPSLWHSGGSEEILKSHDYDLMNLMIYDRYEPCKQRTWQSKTRRLTHKGMVALQAVLHSPVVVIHLWKKKNIWMWWGAHL